MWLIPLQRHPGASTDAIWKDLNLSEIFATTCEVRVGRDPACELQMDSLTLAAMMSRFHAKLVHRSEDEAAVFLIDLDSVNGTW
jgi:hypothetical protein